MYFHVSDYQGKRLKDLFRLKVQKAKTQSNIGLKAAERAVMQKSPTSKGVYT